jgi:hypothetical protein
LTFKNPPQGTLEEVQRLNFCQKANDQTTLTRDAVFLKEKADRLKKREHNLMKTRQKPLESPVLELFKMHRQVKNRHFPAIRPDEDKRSVRSRSMMLCVTA